jgi:hypothetical protein
MQHFVAPTAPQTSDLVEIARCNGDFRRNYGTLIGAFLYLRSLSAAAAGRRPSLWIGPCLAAALSAAVSLLPRLGLGWPL